MKATKDKLIIKDPLIQSSTQLPVDGSKVSPGSIQKKFEESEKRFRMMAELMPQKVWTSDAKGNRNYFNQKLLLRLAC